MYFTSLALLHLLGQMVVLWVRSAGRSYAVKRNPAN